ncbi:MAG: hypothetical protein NTV92_03865, partial [Candidatus Bipolaricaulota bacterium]|nr:hypothetical protein [Candidatus Bipolaricaulota bacterium]
MVLLFAQLSTYSTAQHGERSRKSRQEAGYTLCITATGPGPRRCLQGSEAARGGVIRYFDDTEVERRPPRKNAPPKPAQPEEKTVEEELLQHLTPLIEEHLILEVVRPIKSGKEAVVFCCRAHPSLDRDLVAAKVYRPLE